MSQICLTIITLMLSSLFNKTKMGNYYWQLDMLLFHLNGSCIFYYSVNGISWHALCCDFLYYWLACLILHTWTYYFQDAISSASSITRTLSGELAEGQRKLMAMVAAGAGPGTVNPLVTQLSNGPLAGLHEMVYSVSCPSDYSVWSTFTFILWWFSFHSWWLMFNLNRSLRHRLIQLKSCLDWYQSTSMRKHLLQPSTGVTLL